MALTPDQRIAEIIKLHNQKEDIEAKLRELVTLEKEVVWPADFKLNDEIMKLVTSAGSSGISVLSILSQLRETFPKYNIERRRVASSLVYLHGTKKLVEKIGRGFYRIIESQ